MKKKASYYLYRDKRIFTRQELNEYLEERGANGKEGTGGDSKSSKSITDHVGQYQEAN